MWKIKSVTFEKRNGYLYRCDQYTYPSGFKSYREAANEMERKRVFVVDELKYSVFGIKESEFSYKDNKNRTIVLTIEKIMKMKTETLVKRQLSAEEKAFCRIENIAFYDGTEHKDQKKAEKAANRRVAKIRDTIRKHLEYGVVWDSKMHTHKFFSQVKGTYVYRKRYLKDLLDDHKAFVKAEKKQAKEQEKRKKKEKDFVDSLSDKCGRDVYEEIKSCIRTGVNTTISITESKDNNVHAKEYTTWQKYTKTKSYPRNNQDIDFFVKKGWHIKAIGGLVTFIKGKIDRNGMKCLWIEQGRSIADITMYEGYLVKGEHILAESLKAAQKANRKTRETALANLIGKRAKDKVTNELLRNTTVTFDMSLASGNCRPGTQAFVNKLEDLLGHEVKEMNAYDVLLYGRKFGVETYAKRTINYAIRNNKNKKK